MSVIRTIKKTTCAGRGYTCGLAADNCGNLLDATQLINPRSRINGETPLFVETEQYFLDLGAFTGVLGDYAVRDVVLQIEVLDHEVAPGC